MASDSKRPVIHTFDVVGLELLMTHAEDLSAESLRRPRIVLLAAEYPPVVTATVVWLTEMGLDVVLIRFQAYRTKTETLLSVSQLYPVPDIEEFTVSPRQAEVRATVETKKRTQDTSAVRRLVDSGAPEDRATFRLRTRTEVNAEERAAPPVGMRGTGSGGGSLAAESDTSRPVSTVQVPVGVRHHLRAK